MNKIPIIGWVLAFVANVSLAIPFWIVWTVCGIGKAYFPFVPPVYHDIGFWATVGVFTVLGILRSFSPFRVASSSSADVELKKPA